MNLFKLTIADFGKEQVNIGDTYLFYFSIRTSAIPMFENIQVRFAEYLVERSDLFEVESIYFENEKLVLQAKCVKNPLPFLVVFSAIIAGSSIILYMFGIQLDKVEKIMELPDTKILTITALIIALIVGYKIIFK